MATGQPADEMSTADAIAIEPQPAALASEQQPLQPRAASQEQPDAAEQHEAETDDLDNLKPVTLLAACQHCQRLPAVSQQPAYGTFVSDQSMATMMDGPTESTLPQASVADTGPECTHGPKSPRLHRFNMSVLLLQIAIAVWMLSGTVLWMATLFAICINIIHSSFNAVVVVQIWSPIYGVGVFISFIFLLGRSLVRTYVRLVAFVWKFGASNRPTVILADKNALTQGYPGRAAAAADGMHATTVRASIGDHLVRASAEMEDMMARLALPSGQTSLAIYITIVVLVIGAPLLAVSAVYGYWRVVSNLTMGTSMAAAILVFGVNFVKRVVRSFKVLRSLHKPPDQIPHADYLYASYVASLGMDDGHDLISKIAGLGIGTGFWALICTLVFLSPSENRVLVAMSVLLMVVSAIFRTPIVVRILRKYTESTYLRTSDKRSYYNGQHIWPALTLYLLRVVFYIVGIFSLVYFDVEFQTGAVLGNSASAKWLLLGAFALVATAKDLLFLVPLPSSGDLARAIQLRSLILSSLFLLKLIIAIAARVVVGGYASSLALLVTYLSLDVRHPRCSWTVYSSTRSTLAVTAKARQYSILNTQNAVRLLGLIAGVAVLVGFVTGGSQSLSNESLNLQTFNSSPTSPMFVPPVCSLRVRGLGISDFAEMAHSTYNPTSASVPGNWTADKYPRLLGFKAGISGSLDPTGKSFYIEYRAPPPSNLSVIAVRGTKSFSDIMQDVYIYSAAVLLQSSSYAGTMVNLWPIDIAALFLKAVSSVGRTEFSLSYWEPVAKQVARLRDVEKRDVIIVGHSLGGAIAGIVGAKEDIPAIGISAPGLGLQSATYGFSLQRLTENFLNIVPNHDVVPTFDVQYGLIQDISCYKDEPLKCHSIAQTKVTLAELCGTFGP
ncbi:hypothetical protein BC831DRAFT_287864 [Entophlyctis helioformis]|nr:hypothetical protein BC831DRAFT_287864 [Entophlyctis helioformis]